MTQFTAPLALYIGSIMAFGYAYLAIKAEPGNRAGNIIMAVVCGALAVSGYLGI